MRCAGTGRGQGGELLKLIEGRPSSKGLGDSLDLDMDSYQDDSLDQSPVEEPEGKSSCGDRSKEPCLLSCCLSLLARAEAGRQCRVLHLLSTALDTGQPLPLQLFRTG